VLACDEAPAERVAGGRQLAEVLSRIRAADDRHGRTGGTGTTDGRTGRRR
jgi:hypothetical protein